MSRTPRTFLIVVLAAAAAATAALGASGSRTASSACPDPNKAAAQGGCLIDPWPSGPSKNSTAVAKAAFARQYTAVWGYLHPKLQQAVSESAWQSCQKRYPLSSPGVKIKSVRVADSKPVPISLPVLGKAKIRAVTLQVLFTTPASSAMQIALEYAYWVQDKGNWKAVWLPDAYNLYKSGKCDSSQTRGLY